MTLLKDPKMPDNISRFAFERPYPLPNTHSTSLALPMAASTGNVFGAPLPLVGRRHPIISSTHQSDRRPLVYIPAPVLPGPGGSGGGGGGGGGGGTLGPHPSQLETRGDCRGARGRSVLRPPPTKRTTPPARATRRQGRIRV